MAVNAPLNRKLRMGLVGGGQGAFIGAVHMRAAVMIIAPPWSLALFRPTR